MAVRRSVPRKVGAAVTAVALLATTACGGSGSGSGSGSSAQDQGVKDKTITIGFSTPNSGNIAAYGAIADATMAYLKWKNESGGVDGYKFDFETADNQGTVSGGAGAMQQLIAKKPFAIEVITTPAFNGAANAIKTKKSTLPVFGMASGAAIKQVNLPHVFGVYTDYTEESFFALDHIVKTQGLKKVALLHDTASADAGQKDGDYIKSIGGELVTNISVPAGATNTTPYVQQVQNSGAQAVLIMMDITLAANFVKSAKAQGLTTPLFGYSGSLDSSMTKIAGAAAEGFTVSGPFPPLTSTEPTMAQFKEIMPKYAPNAVTALGVIGWNGGAVIVAAVDQMVKAKEPMTQANFEKALFKLSGQTVGFTKVTIQPDAHYTLVGKDGLNMYTVRNGGFVPVTEK
jgi:ABC-type branched-subunit amino acid transport system substrate-binding protein